jgi:DedD protein
VRFIMDKEKKKLILVAVTVGVFLVILISAAILILTPKVPAGGAAFSSARPISPGQQASMDALETLRNGGAVQGIQTPPNAGDIQGSEFHISGETAPIETSGTAAPSQITINVPKPSTAAVPDVSVETAPRSRTESPAQKPAPVAAAPAKKPASSTPVASSKPAASSAKPAQTKHNDYWVQTGAFTAKVRAEGVKETLAEKGITSIIENREVDGKTWDRVRVGPYTSETEANYWLALVKSIDGFTDSQVRQTVSMR